MCPNKTQGIHVFIRLPISLSSTLVSSLCVSSSLILLTIQPNTLPYTTLAIESLASERIREHTQVIREITEKLSSQIAAFAFKTHPKGRTGQSAYSTFNRVEVLDRDAGWRNWSTAVIVPSACCWLWKRWIDSPLVTDMVQMRHLIKSSSWTPNWPWGGEKEPEISSRGFRYCLLSHETNEINK